MTKTIEELEAQLEKALTSINKLEAKNEEIIGKLQSANARADAAEELADQAEANAAAGNELKTLQREFNKLEKSLNDITTERDTLSANLRTTRVDSAISAAIASGNVRPEMVEAVEAIMHRKIDYTDGEATINGKSISDFAKSYFGKEGSHFVRAADNSGADASGNNGSKAIPHSMTKENFDINEFTMIQLDNPELANTIADAVGRPDLKSNV